MHHSERSALWNFKQCAEQAPDGCYEQAKALNSVISQASESLMREIRALGLKASGNDLAFDLEAAIYDYAKRSNPEATVFATAEGFGSSMDQPERARVMAQAETSRDFLAAHAKERAGSPG